MSKEACVKRGGYILLLLFLFPLFFSIIILLQSLDPCGLSSLRWIVAAVAAFKWHRENFTVQLVNQ